MERRLADRALENVRVMYMNMSGRKDEWNTNGERTLTVLLPDGIAEDMASEGWNVKFPQPDPNRPDLELHPTIKATARFDNYPPLVYMITGDSMVKLDGDSVGDLDNMQIAKVDIVLNPYRWTNKQGQSGIKAYVRKAYFVIEMDAFDQKYAHLRGVSEDDVPF